MNNGRVSKYTTLMQHRKRAKHPFIDDWFQWKSTHKRVPYSYLFMFYTLFFHFLGFRQVSIESEAHAKQLENTLNRNEAEKIDVVETVFIK